MSHRSSRRPYSHDSDEEEYDERSGAASSRAAAAASSSAAAAEAGASAAAAAAAASSANPLSDLLRDVQCGICLSVAVRPVSLPCNHFYCEQCMQQQLREESEREQSKRKAKSNATLRQRLLCPTCRSEYNRRTIVEDPLIRHMAQLALQLRRQPDVRELVGAEESIFDLSQQTAPSPPRPTPSRAASAARRDAATTTPSSHGHSRQVPSKTTTPSSGAASSGLDALMPPVIHDPFAFHASDTQHSTGSDEHASSSAAAAAATPKRPLSSGISSSLVTPQRAGRGGRKNYREVSQSSLESGGGDSVQSSDDADDEDDGSDADAYPRMAPPSSVARRAAHSHSPSPSVPTARDGSTAVKSKKCKGYPETELPADACMVCCAVSEEEAVVTCRLCKVRVHSQLCYGNTTHEISEAERANWHCDRCSESMGTKLVTCAVCPNTDDQAFKKTDQGTWIHASCAQWIPEVRFRYPAERRELVEHLKNIPANRWSVPCRFCTGKGAILQCTFPRCRFGYHVPCGLRRGICFELVQADGASQLMSQDEGSSDIFYHSYCRQHVAQRHLVPACNSAFAVSAKKKKRGGKRRRDDKDEEEAAAAAAAGRMAGGSSSEEEEATSAHKRARGDSSLINRSINLAETSLDTTMNDSSVRTPIRPSAAAGGAFSVASLLTPSSSSPLVSHTPQTGRTVPAAAAAAASSTPSSSSSSHLASRKLDFPTPSLAHNVTTSVGVVTRSSPLKKHAATATAIVRSASAGLLGSHTAPAASPSRTALTRTSSVRGRSPSTATTTATAPVVAPASAAAAPSPRAPLRSMGRAEVNSRDAAAAAAAAASTPVVKTEPSLISMPAGSSSRSGRAGREAAKRHHVVMMGTRLDSEQQGLLDELAALLNSMAKKEHHKHERSAAVPYTGPVVSVQSAWDERVTHVVTAASDANGFVLPSRTIKYFQGMLSSAWVVGIDWVAASICARKLVPEGEYLVQGDAKLNGGELTFGAKRARNRERLFAHAYFVLNRPFKQPLRSDVEQLVRMGGGEVREEIPTVKKRGGAGGSGAAAAATSASHGHKEASGSSERHHSDIEEYSQTDDMHVSPAAAAKRAGAAAAAASAASAAGGAPLVAERGKWFLLCDDTATKGATTRAHLKQLVSPALWTMCERQQIPVVGVNWLFDSISAFKLRPLPT